MLIPFPHSQEAHYYAQWLETSSTVREPVLRPGRRLTEQELQIRFFGGELGRTFSTTEGRSVEIVDFGHWNRDDGPLFANATISIDGGPLQQGGIALYATPHPLPDPEDPQPPVLSLYAGSATGNPPGLGHWVALDSAAYAFEPEPLPEADGFTPALEKVELPRFLAFLEAAAQYRLCRKSAELKALETRFGPEEALYQALAETLGYRVNRLPFRLLAQRFPVALLRQQPMRIEPVLFAGSGFMSATDLGAMAGDTRSYLRTLWETWWPRRTELERLILPIESWTRAGIRPVNHPQRRLAALSILVEHWPIIGSLARACEPKTLYGFFRQIRHPYWDHHFTLTSRRSTRPMALLGPSRVTDLLANVMIPRNLREQPSLWTAYLELPPSDPSRTVGQIGQYLLGERFKSLKLRLVHQQGLLEVSRCTADPNTLERLATDLHFWPVPER